MIGLGASGFTPREARKQTLPWLDRLGLVRARLAHDPSSCRWVSASVWRSPGRWSANRGCCLTDEPTGNLDSERGKEVLELLREICREREAPGVLVTHDPSAVEFVDRVLHAARRAPGGRATERSRDDRPAREEPAEPADLRDPPVDAAVPVQAAACARTGWGAAGGRGRRDRGRAGVRRAAGQREPRELRRQIDPRADGVGALRARRALSAGVRRGRLRSARATCRAWRWPRRCCARTSP